MKKIVLLLVSFFILPLSSYAYQYCDDQTDATARTLAANVNVVYEVNSDQNDNPYFTIYITNLNSDMLLIDTGSGNSYKGFNENKTELVINSTISGKHNFMIYSFKCKNKVGGKTITLPSYNEYYLDPLCQGLESYKQCQKWSGYSASRAQFEQDIQDIKDKIKKAEEEKEGTKISKFWYNKLVKVFFKTWWLIIIDIMLGVAIYYYYKNRAKKKEYDFNI